MPVLGSIIRQKAQRERVQATNKIDLEPGWYDGKIVDVWIFDVDGDGKFTKEKTGEKKCEIKVAIYSEGMETGYVLARRMRAYLSANSHFAKAIESLTGLKAGEDGQRSFDTDKLIGMDVEVQTTQAGEYVNIEAFKPKARRPIVKPAPRPASVHHDDVNAYSDDDFRGLERR